MLFDAGAIKSFWILFNKTADLVSHYSFSIININGLICQRFVHVMQILTVSVSRVTLCLSTKGYAITFDVSKSLCNGVNKLSRKRSRQFDTILLLSLN